jgi:hypothetical protein
MGTIDGTPPPVPAKGVRRIDGFVMGYTMEVGYKNRVCESGSWYTSFWEAGSALEWKTGSGPRSKVKSRIRIIIRVKIKELWRLKLEPWRNVDAQMEDAMAQKELWVCRLYRSQIASLWFGSGSESKCKVLSGSASRWKKSDHDPDRDPHQSEIGIRILIMEIRIRNTVKNQMQDRLTVLPSFIFSYYAISKP